MSCALLSSVSNNSQLSTPGGFVEWAASDGRKGKLNGPGKTRSHSGKSGNASSEKGDKPTKDETKKQERKDAAEDENPYNFTPEQDKQLLEWKAANGSAPWAKCAEEIGKSTDQCKERFKQIRPKDENQGAPKETGGGGGGNGGGGGQQQQQGQQKLTNKEKKALKKQNQDQNKNQGQHQNNKKDENVGGATDNAGGGDDIFGAFDPFAIAGADDDDKKSDAKKSDVNVADAWPSGGTNNGGGGSGGWNDTTGNTFGGGGWEATGFGGGDDTKSKKSASKKGGSSNKGDDNAWGKDSWGGGDSKSKSGGSKKGGSSNKGDPNGWDSGGWGNDTGNDSSGNNNDPTWASGGGDTKSKKSGSSNNGDGDAWNNDSFDNGGGDNNTTINVGWDAPATGGGDTTAGWNNMGGGAATNTGPEGWSGAAATSQKAASNAGDAWGPGATDGANDTNNNTTSWDTNPAPPAGGKPASNAPSTKSTSKHRAPLELEVKPDETFSADDLRLVARILQEDYRMVWNRVSWRFRDKTGRTVGAEVFKKKITGKVEGKERKK
jgi:hypothetical protein